MKKCLTTFMIGAALAVVAVDDGFKPYQTILERMPFGRPPAGFNPDNPGIHMQSKSAVESEVPATNPEQEKLAEYIRSIVRVCALNVPPNGEPVVGFTDAAHTPPRNHLLARGQTADGWTVLDIDTDSCRAVLSRDGVSVSLALNGGRGGVATSSR